MCEEKIFLKSGNLLKEENETEISLRSEAEN
jgi:hypothetical protein